jgi:hypothetical protein
MNQQQSHSRRVAQIRVEPYLAAYARRKFPIDPITGGIKVPDKFDLYHCIWHSMSKWPLERWNIGVRRKADAPEGNLLIHLPNRRSEGGIRKNPLFWNYISRRHARLINRELKRLFDWEFHHYVEILLEYHPDMTKKEAVQRFAKKYALGIDCEDALLKNFQRHEKTIRIFLGLRKRKNAENNVKSASTSTTVLSCPKPPLSGFSDGVGDGLDLCRSEYPLAGVIAKGLQLLGETRVERDPSL